MSRVLLVGSGLTSAMTAYLMRPMYKNSNKIFVYERARGMGGRMGTTRSPSQPDCIVDMGIQYISAPAHYVKTHKTFYEDLEAENLLQRVIISEIIEGYKFSSPGLTSFIAPQGFGAVVKYFFNKSDTLLKFEHDVVAINLDSSNEQRPQWRVSVQNGKDESFDSVLLTIPVPELFDIKGEFQTILDKKVDIKKHLQNVTYSSRFALGLFYDKNISLSLAYPARYLTGDVIRYFSVDNQKRGLNSGTPTSIVVHTSKEIGKNYGENDLDKVQSIILERLKKFIPDLPTPNHTKCHYWKHSQVLQAYREQPGFVVLEEKPLLIVAGDGFTHSSFDGCIASGLRLAHRSRKIFYRKFKPDPRP